jgi:hypothetical protein
MIARVFAKGVVGMPAVSALATGADLVEHHDFGVFGTEGLEIIGLGLAELACQPQVSFGR